ncbi:hypothetical protein GCM10027280_45600 [Micromonospora polyrhachis]|uniref:Uncharacterized protein n=1 Tax=Micromonospora polyrhachis TaxID=1282883 RepID=A0A7W7SQF5_9ACTN|nr:hypothetical protein [Micromonospora polyrhachis]MBB4958926.1 hypothetical protein [Micromonospora polyrhachis]
MDANDLLMGGGIKSAAFPDQQYGTTVGGPIVREPQVRQQTDFDSGKPKVYDDGKPVMQIIVHVKTTQRDPMTPTDDGVRALYLRGQIQQAVRDAVRAAGAPGLLVGGELHVTYVRDEPNSRGRGKPKKVYEARYTPPPSQGNNALMGDAPDSPAPQAATTAPAGVDQAIWDQMSGEQRTKLLAAMGVNQ